MSFFSDWLDRVTGREVVTGKRYVTEPNAEPGERLLVGKIDGEWHYFYDSEWTKVSNYGGRGAVVRGDKLVWK